MLKTSFEAQNDWQNSNSAEAVMLYSTISKTVTKGCLAGISQSTCQITAAWIRARR